ncbi:MAG: transposase [Sphingomonadales bacterium]|nr:transposase [Sphingomonadales bacterium]MDE2170492.1 transposase [Sphingomonadales bacterium]
MRLGITSASAADGRLLRPVVSTDNTGSEVWADSAYRSNRNEKWLSDRMLTSRIHRRKPMGKPMSKATARANAAKSSIRAHIKHAFAHQKNRFGVFIRTIGLVRAEPKLTLCNLAYNFNRLIFHERCAKMGRLCPQRGQARLKSLTMPWETDQRRAHPGRAASLLGALGFPSLEGPGFCGSPGLGRCAYRSIAPIKHSEIPKLSA